MANYIRIHFCTDLKVKLSFTYTLVNFICIFCLSQKCHSQDFSAIGFGTSVFSEVQLSGCGSECSQTFLFDPSGLSALPVSFAPNGTFFVGVAGVGDIVEVDLGSESYMTIYTLPVEWQTQLFGFVATSNTTFYAMHHFSSGTSLFRLNIDEDEVTELGSTGYTSISDLTLYNGDFYFINSSPEGIVKVDSMNPSNSIQLFSIPSSSGIGYSGLTASPFCQTLLAVDRTDSWENTFLLINLLDGSVTHICDSELFVLYLSSLLEHSNPAPCEVMLDLDCDDSNGVVPFDCLDIDGVAITDSDIGLFADALLTEITITIAPPIPDAPNEFLTYTGSIPNIDPVGSGTSSITLINAGGATFQDFKDALQLIVYQNISQQPTPGLRTIEVQFTTESGAMSNIAEYYIEVEELGHVVVDLGPDQQVCEGTNLILDAGNPGATYAWSTGDATQTILVDQSGQYIVTVSDGVNCPGMDTVLLEVLPNIDVSLAGDTYICDNESATLIIQTDTPFALDIEIQADPGSSFSFSGVIGTFTFTDLPPVPTIYTITSVTPSQGACITLSDPVQFVDVFPSYTFEVDTSLCEGDSIWLGFFWETEAGTYENMLQTFDGCDSFVTTHITLLPAVQIAIDTTTCSASEAGVFITHLDNPNGCDTVVTTTVSLLELDTTYLMTTACSIDEVGVTTTIEAGSDGCDSIVITTIDYIPPVDTTYTFEMSCDTSQGDVQQYVFTAIDGCDSIVVSTTTVAPLDTTYTFETTCDSTQGDVQQYVFTSVDGCDSVVVTTTTYSLSDTTYTFETTCDSSLIDVQQYVLTAIDGCDSVVIVTTTYSQSDTTYTFETTCDPSQGGVTHYAFTSVDGCDSIVTTTVMVLPSDTIYLSDASCVPGDTGVWTMHLVNQYGCDSIVVTQVALLPSDQVYLHETTCQASEAGEFITTHLNQYGCDSVVTRTVELLDVDTTYTFEETCDPAQVDVLQYVYTGTDGCDSIVVETTTLFPLPILIIQSAIDYNGFDISCTDEPDGSAVAIISGTEPFTYLWSTTETDQMITGLSAGDYAVTITDGNGCTAIEVITLEQPDELMMSLEVTEPDCFDQALGAITINASGGVPPYSYAIDGGLFQGGSVFGALGDGIYQLTVMDANECSASEIIAIDVPLMVQVDLGDNQTISLGDSALLEAIINLPFDSIANLAWTGLDTSACANCLTQIVAPVITTAYSVSLTSVDGCSDRDSVTIAVTREQQLYIPNIFSPNGDGINDVLQISADAGVRELSVMEIYDRWGNLVFRFEHKSPDDPTAHWDGSFNGQALNPGVYAYRVVIEFASGETEVRYGDVTLIR